MDSPTQATLSITWTDSNLICRLEGITAEPIEAQLSNGIKGHVEVVQRSINGTIDQDDVRKLRLPENPGLIQAQQNKTFLNAIGSYIHENLLPPTVSSQLKNTENICLSFLIDDALADIPWELTYDGDDFYCMKYTLSRKIHSPIQKKPDSRQDNDLKILLIEDPTGSLPASKNEIDYLTGSLLNLSGVKVQRKGGEMRKKDFLESLNSSKFDILHFSGHGYFDSENPAKSHLLFYDFENPCLASEIAENLGEKSPALIFSNACTSAQTIAGQQGLVHAFLSGGTIAYIGTLWPVEDELAGFLGAEFYRYIIHGKTVSEALRIARSNARNKFGWSSLSWAAYILYGESEIKLFQKDRA